MAYFLLPEDHYVKTGTEDSKVCEAFTELKHHPEKLSNLWIYYSNYSNSFRSCANKIHKINTELFLHFGTSIAVWHLPLPLMGKNFKSSVPPSVFLKIQFNFKSVFSLALT